MPIVIKKGRALNKPRPAPIVEGAAVVTKGSNPSLKDQIHEYTVTDPRYIQAKSRPIGEQGTMCEFCSKIYLMPCDVEEKEFCINHLYSIGKIQNTKEWIPHAEKGYALVQKRLIERKKGV